MASFSKTIFFFFLIFIFFFFIFFNFFFCNFFFILFFLFFALNSLIFISLYGDFCCNDGFYLFIYFLIFTLSFFGLFGGLSRVQTCSRSLSRLLSGVCEGPFGGLTGISLFFLRDKACFGSFFGHFLDVVTWSCSVCRMSF